MQSFFFDNAAMLLDLPTLAAITIFIATIIGVLFLSTWVQNREIDSFGWWGLSYLLCAAGFGFFFLRGHVPDVLSIDIANALVILYYGLIWSSVRAFNGKPFRVSWLLAGPIAWLVLCRIPIFYGDINLRVIGAALLAGPYSLGGAYEFWRGGDRRLATRWPAVVFLFIHGVALLARVPFAVISPITAASLVLNHGVLAIIAVELILYSICMSFLLLAMAKERVEVRLRAAALTDPLTGTLNRRGLFQFTQVSLAQAQRTSSSIAFLLIDLDHFKRVNDTFGHQVGDRVLQLLCVEATRMIRGSDILGRMGGEEFGIVLPMSNWEGAEMLAERLRRSFAAAADDVGGRAIGATISIGVSLSSARCNTIECLVRDADRALYEAKAAGRNRVRTAAAMPDTGWTFAGDLAAFAGTASVGPSRPIDRLSNG
ncbi:diguanylate cyclase (GGDEF) domain-containing protein [Faunimonas pinastri]|uniref:diguanylate cyclase n=1 Tax=Faunimonas pinastri TaxID=1855383 RepID=A0A1H9A0N4_9HYPH|nr:diguanylate cyclase [Faunimonas pinastri]SEP70061.1 diguanylate cyclase (GGDEF) domain-containing protein [Faunimonas pinastri]